MSLERKFFFDTADYDVICRYWDRLNRYVLGKEVVGVTTNPNALEKVACHTLSHFEWTIYRLCKLVTSIRKDNEGMVYVQMPYSLMKKDEIISFAKYVADITDGKTSVALKIPPFKYVLDLVDELNEYLDVNVTGIAECATALKCLTYNVRHVSVIPGRMEEKGIDAKRQIQYINQRNETETEIIAGSMRTLEGLQWVISNNTVPTIGTRVFDQIVDDTSKIKFFCYMWEIVEENKNEEFAPLITEESIELSKQFFIQMDACGETLYEAFMVKTGK